MKKWIILFLIFLLATTSYAAPKYISNTLLLNGACAYNASCVMQNLIVLGNLSVFGDFINITVQNVTINATTILLNGTNINDVFIPRAGNKNLTGDWDYGSKDITGNGTITTPQVNVNDIYDITGGQQMISWDAGNTEIDILQKMEMNSNDISGGGTFTASSFTDTVFTSVLGSFTGVDDISMTGEIGVGVGAGGAKGTYVDGSHTTWITDNAGDSGKGQSAFVALNLNTNDFVRGADGTYTWYVEKSGGTTASRITDGTDFCDFFDGNYGINCDMSTGGGNAAQFYDGSWTATFASSSAGQFDDGTNTVFISDSVGIHGTDGTNNFEFLGAAAQGHVDDGTDNLDFFDGTYIINADNHLTIDHVGNLVTTGNATVDHIFANNLVIGGSPINESFIRINGTTVLLNVTENLTVMNLRGNEELNIAPQAEGDVILFGDKAFASGDNTPRLRLERHDGAVTQYLEFGNIASSDSSVIEFYDEIWYYRQSAFVFAMDANGFALPLDKRTRYGTSTDRAEIKMDKDQTNNALVIGLSDEAAGDTSRSLIITEFLEIQAASDNFQLPSKPNPTVFITSTTGPATAQGRSEWMSLTHNQSSGVIETGYGNITLNPKHRLLVLSNASINGDLDVQDNITGNQIYGEMWNRTNSASPFTMDINTVGIYYNITNLTSGMQNGFSFTAAAQENGGSYLTAHVSGRYRAVASLSSIIGTASGDVYGYAISHEFNRAGHNNCYARRTAVNKLGNVGITCFIDVEAGTRVNLQVEQETGGVARDVSFSTVNLNLVRIGDIP